MYTHEIEVRFCDYDGMGHVNNAVFLTYLEMGRINYFGYLLKKYNVSHEFSFIMAHVSIDYKKPIEQQFIKTEIWVSKIGTSSFDFSYRIIDDNGNIFALASTVQVSFDYKAKTKTTLPEELKNVLDKEKIDQ